MGGRGPGATVLSCPGFLKGPPMGRFLKLESVWGGRQGAQLGTS